MSINPDLNAIAHLDFHDITCQCEHREHTGGCKNRATHKIARHAIFHCNDPGLDPFGNIIEIRCAACVMALQTEITCKLVSLNKAATKVGMRAECTSCGGPIAELSDVLKSVEPLYPPSTKNADR